LKKLFYLLLLLTLYSCNKEEEPQIDRYPFKSSWIIGEWALKKGVQLSEYKGDTIFTVADNTKTVYYTGIKRNSPFKVKVKFDENGSYSYEETNEFNSGSINSTWKWLNSSQNKTQLLFPIAFNGYFGENPTTPFQLIKLDEKQLIVEDIGGYFYFEYERVGTLDDRGDFEPIQLISPQSIIGNWKLTSFYEPLYIKNGTAKWVENDTFYYQAYDYNQTLRTDKEKYALTVSFTEKGNFTYSEERNNILQPLSHRCWFWNDENEPHTSFSFPPILHGYNIQFMIKTLSRDSLIIVTDQPLFIDYNSPPISYKFKRIY